MKITQTNYRFLGSLQQFSKKNKVSEIVQTFYVGGYQPAQKWLKDRKGRELSVDDILHYQKSIVALAETDRIMKEIDIYESQPGWGSLIIINRL